MLCEGAHYGKITVDKKLEGSEYYLCKCACGNEVILTEEEILSQSCHRACSVMRGEVCAADLFDELDVPYIAQMSFADTDLIFDFYLPTLNTIIECDGAQHWRAQNSEWASRFKLQETRERDAYKDEYCATHGIKLVRIPHWDKKKLNVDYLRKVL